MQGNLSHSISGHAHAVSLGPNHGYRFEGDIAFLNAELAIDARETVPNQNWALQLWACDAPYQGGPLRGIKVAEAALALDGAYDPSHLEANALAQLPPVQRDYAMVLVLASGDRGAYDQVHDFSNYAARQTFEGPHLSGSVGYRFEADQVVLQAGSVRNPRAAENLSGTLALELWALRYPYEGGSLGDGTRIAQVEFGPLAGQQELDALEYRLQRTEPPAGEWQLALLLREWTEAGYQTRDYANFAVAYRAEPAEPVVRLVSAPVPVSEPVIAQPALEQAPAWTTSVQPANAVHTLHLVEREPAQQPTWGEPARESARSEPTQAAPTQALSQSEPAAELAKSEPSLPAPAQAESAQAEPRQEVAPRERANGAPSAAEPAKVERADAAAAKAEPAKAEPTQPVRNALTAVQPAKAAPSKAAAPAPVKDGKVSISTGSVEALSLVKGLNLKLAQSIVRARPFNSLDDLKAVRGIGDKLLQKLRAQLTL